MKIIQRLIVVLTVAVSVFALCLLRPSEVGKAKQESTGSNVRNEIIDIDLIQPSNKFEEADGVSTESGIELLSWKDGGYVVSEAIKVPIDSPEPFLALAVKLNGEFHIGGALSLNVRSRSTDGQWREWIEIQNDADSPNSNSEYSGALVFLPKDAVDVQYSIRFKRSDNSTDRVIVSRVRLSFISPGATPQNVLSDLTGHSEGPIDSNVPMAVSKPTVLSRTAWGCPDGQSSPGWTPQYTTVSHLIVHHTVNANTSSDWPAVVRAIWSDHTNSNGWGDIGYNYLVDPNGNIYEGRAGGDNVMGAHFSCANPNTMGIAALGTFSTVGPSTSALTSIEKMLAWKADQRGIDPLATTYHSATQRELENIAGHRDANGTTAPGTCDHSTACPGNVLYAQLPTIRNNVRNLIGTAFPNPTVSSSLVITGNSCVDGVLTAKFTITNRGNAAITLKRLTAGGRLNNDNTGAGGFPDFSFANNVTLNPGASYDYAGTQTVTRTGNYGFFVAYERTDGSWVTNVPKDAGVANTASTTVSGQCGAANPTVSSSLVISGNSCVGGLLTAQFTITNRGNAAITLKRLTAGGRLNGDNTGAGGFPDFSFANNVLLNPGASYNYTGTQTVTRSGNYSFFVAYEKTDGSWVTNVPKDAGVANTASTTVSGQCGAANPTVSSSLVISGNSCVGGVLTAQFTITNRGNAAITLQRLAAGGRLNGDNTGAGGFPDFSFANNVLLNPGASYNYTGTQTLTRTGNYSFFVAYQRTDGSWVTNVPKDAGVANTASTTVSGQCGAANPTVSSSLVISGNSCVGGVLTAQFTITNRGNAAITLQRLAAGGRLNGDNTGTGGFPDFSFANNVLLNPGASYNYTGTQTLTRTGNYSFFVAYQRTDGSWVTNVPKDAGVANTASTTVSGQCGAANPMVSQSLTLSPNGPYSVNQTLTARFSITNRGSAPITLQRLTAGGRLNGDNTCAGGCPDFSFTNNVTLNPGAKHDYEGTQLMSRAGSYSFYVAYQKTDGSWVTNVPADAGVTNTLNITVGNPTQTIAWEFNNSGNFEGWNATNASASSVNSGKYFIDPSGVDPYTTGPSISTQASTYKYLIVFMASNGLDSTGAVYFKTQAENFFSDDKKVLFTVSNCSLCGNAGFVRYAVFMSGNSKWTGTITGLRLDPTGSGQAGTNADSIGIDYLRLSSSSLAFERSPFKPLDILFARDRRPLGWEGGWLTS